MNVHRSPVAQVQMVEKHLQSGRSITPLEALELYGSMRLGAIIFILRKRYGAHRIPTVWERSPDGKKRWARYHMVGAADENQFSLNLTPA